MKIKFLNVATLVVLVIAIAGAWWYGTRHNATWTSITTFEQCAQLYPVMESYPEQCATPDGRSFVRDISNDMQNLIQVSYPQPNAPVASPLTVTGQARGNFYFEASFPVKLLDANGAVLAQVPAQAQGEWMTEEFVPFKASLNFKTPTTKTGVLVLQNDNPSGDPAKSKELRIPVQFGESGVVKFGQKFTLTTGDTVFLPDDLEVKLAEITDSRCKPGVQCIWAGELSPLLWVTRNGATPSPLKDVQLGTLDHKVVYYDTYSFTLVEATETSATIIADVAAQGKGGSGVVGYVHVGPTCPVGKNPPDPKCADKPAANIEVVFTKVGGAVAARVDSTEQGHIRVALPAGSYVVTAVSPANNQLPRCETKTIALKTGELQALDISCDSGIR